MKMIKLIVGAAVTVVAALAVPTVASADSGWKQCSSGSTKSNTIVTGDYGYIDVYALKGQLCSTAVRSERWLRTDRGTATNGWKSSGVKYKDFGDGDYTTTVIVRKHRTHIKIVQYNGEGWG